MHSKVDRILQQCKFRQAFYLWCITFAAKARWRDVIPPLQRLVRSFFMSWMQTRVNEKGNKVIRDSVMLDAQTNVMLGRISIES